MDQSKPAKEVLLKKRELTLEDLKKIQGAGGNGNGNNNNNGGGSAPAPDAYSLAAAN